MTAELTNVGGQTAATRKKIAWLSPFPPQRSGIANCSYWLVRALKREFDIDLYYDSDQPSTALTDEFNTYELSRFEEFSATYDEIVYHLGNNSQFHKRIFELAWQLSGTVVLHDYNLSAFMHEAFYRGNKKLYLDALLQEYRAGANGFPLSAPTRASTLKFPMSHGIVSRSKKVVVHHRWVRDQFKHPRIFVIPHFALVPDKPAADDLENFKRKLGLKPNYFVLACLGFVNSNKLPGLQIRVVKRLLQAGYPVQLVFAGEPAPDVEKLRSEIVGPDDGHIIFTGYQGEADYLNTIVASDVIINLRNPSMGEASLTLIEALTAAKPTIVSDTNQYKEFPDKVCWKLAHDDNEADVLYEYLKVLLGDRHLRQTLSANASEHVKSVFAWNAIIDRWVQMLSC